MQKWDTAESLLYVCRKLWGQPYVTPVYTLLLHQWLLLNKDAGGSEQRHKHINVLVSGESVWPHTVFELKPLCWSSKPCLDSQQSLAGLLHMACDKLCARCTVYF